MVQPRPEGADPGRGSGFQGDTFESEHDEKRLKTQLEDIKGFLQKSGGWWTVAEIADRTQHPEPSVSAQLRNLRKAEHGGWTVERRHRGERADALYEFRLLPPGQGEQPRSRRKLSAELEATRKDLATAIERIADLERRFRDLARSAASPSQLVLGGGR